MRESRTYGSGRGACDETHVPTATTARVHHAARRRGGGVADRGARAAAGDAGDWVPRPRIARHFMCSDSARPKENGYVEGENVVVEIAGPQINWIDCRRWQPICLPPGCRDRRVRRGRLRLRRQGGNRNDPRQTLRPRRVLSCRHAGRAWRQLDGQPLFKIESSAERLELLRVLVPGATRVAALVNPANVSNRQTTLRDSEVPTSSPWHSKSRSSMPAPARKSTRPRQLRSATCPDIVGVRLDQLTDRRRVQLVHLASRYAIPATYGLRDFVEAGCR